MDRREREAIMREGGVLDEQLLDRASERKLREDLEGSPVTGKPIPRRLRNFERAVDAYVTSLGGPLPYMQRLRDIDAEIAQHEERLREAWDELAAELRGEELARRWELVAAGWDFTGVNELIDAHNRYYPIESRLPMDPRTGDFVLVGGRPYRRDPLDARWILERFPPLDRAA